MKILIRLTSLCCFNTETIFSAQVPLNSISTPTGKLVGTTPQLTTYMYSTLTSSRSKQTLSKYHRIASLRNTEYLHIQVRLVLSSTVAEADLPSNQSRSFSSFFSSSFVAVLLVLSFPTSIFQILLRTPILPLSGSFGSLA